MSAFEVHCVIVIRDADDVEDALDAADSLLSTRLTKAHEWPPREYRVVEATEVGS